MDRNDTGGEIKHLYARQAGALEHPGQGRLVGMHADRFGEIAVRRGVAGHLPLELEKPKADDWESRLAAEARAFKKR